MKTHIIFVRHGNSVFNDTKYRDVIQGASFLPDSPLTTIGEEQTASLGRYLKGRYDWGSALVYSSPLTRSIQTGRILRNMLGVTAELITDHALSELNQKGWSGLERRDVYQRNQGIMSKFVPLFRPPQDPSTDLGEMYDSETVTGKYDTGGESLVDVAIRVYGFLRGLTQHSCPPVVFAVTHKFPISQVISYGGNFSAIDDAQAALDQLKSGDAIGNAKRMHSLSLDMAYRALDVIIPNCGIYVLRYDSDKGKISPDLTSFYMPTDLLSY